MDTQSLAATAITGAHALRHAGLLDALLLRAAAGWARRYMIDIHGLEHIMPEHDPFILALNHGTRFEAIAVPALLMYARGGQRIHFMADWNFRLIPGVGFLYRRAGVITLTRKPARPRALNVLRPLFKDRLEPMDAARLHLAGGRSLGIFPEGTVNRNPGNLLRGRFGVAGLSHQTGAAIIPAGITYPDIAPGTPVPETARFSLRIGAPIVPDPKLSVRDLHARIMGSIGRLSGKSWGGITTETSNEELLAHPG